VTVVTAAATSFERSFGGEPDGVWTAPGRVNLIGEHVDYNAGLCLPLAIGERTAAAVRARDDDRLRLVSTQTEQTWDGRLDDVGPGRPQGWPAYVAGVVWSLREAGHDVPGIEVAVASSVPVGAGLSSSAALECAVALAVAELAGLPTDDAGRGHLAAACVRAENEVAGAPTGGMDQAVSLLAREGHALLLDCRDGTHRHVTLPLDAAGVVLLVVDTRAPHRLVDGQYAARRALCADAAARLGVTSLREAVPADLDRLEDAEQRRRARHVITEIGRVAHVVDLLQRNDIEGIGPLLDASHDSLRDDFEVSSTELETAVAAARAAGALGARMTGAGFGGSAIALVRQADVGTVSAAVRRSFADAGLGPPELYTVTPSHGAERARAGAP